jgi:hypothetical protein
VLELVSPVEHDDVQPEEVRKLTPEPREVEVNPLVTENTESLLDSETSLGTLVTDDVSEPLQDGVEQDHVSPRELEESPKGAREIVTRPSTVEHDNMQEDHVNTLKDIVVMDDVTEEPTVTKTTSLEVNNLPTVTAHEVVGMQQQEVHPSKNIQHGLDLWERVREYDARTTVEAAQSDTSIHVLTRNQKQKIKVRQVMSKQPSKSRARGDNKSIDQ